MDRDKLPLIEERLSLWLAVGNGGGLLAAGAAFADHYGKPLGVVLLPSLWAFAIGLVATYVMHALFMLDITETRRPAWLDPAGLTAIFASALGALVGIFYPLAMATWAMLSSG